MRTSTLKGLALVVPMANLLAQTPALQLNTMYRGQDLNFDLNKDGTLDWSEFGEFKKRN